MDIKGHLVKYIANIVLFTVILKIIVYNKEA